MVVCNYEGCSRKPKEENPDGTINEVERLKPNCARRMLGLWQYPTGGSDMEQEYLQGIAKTWKEEIHMGKLDGKDIWSNFYSRVMKTLEYPPTATIFMQE